MHSTIYVRALSMHLPGIQRLHASMRSVGIDRVHFQVQHVHLRFAGLFLADVKPYQLALLVIGHDIVLMFDVDNQYNVSAYIRDPATLEALKAALNLGKGGRALRVSELLRDLDNNLPGTVSTRDKPTTADVARVYRHVEETDKVHFIKFTPHSRTGGHNVSRQNLEKTRLLLGQVTHDYCKLNNVSSCWSDIAPPIAVVPVLPSGVDLVHTP